MSGTRKRRRRKKKIVRRIRRCPNCNSKLKRTGVPGRYLCVKEDVFWTIAALKTVAREKAKMKALAAVKGAG
ncbi:MAG: hypothetical protein OK422_06380 [Thaumarchaeota archaeon]|nr:hypothetical protein [Nitrososphaerota archaeon]